MTSVSDMNKNIDNYDITARAFLTWIQPVELRDILVKTHDLQVGLAKYFGKSIDKTFSSFLPTK